MWLQKTYLKKDYTLVSGQKDIFDVPRTSPLAGILLRWSLTTGVAEAAALADEAVIEVIKNGSEVITSLQYGELVAYNMLMKAAGYQIADLGASATAYYVLGLPFGRYLGDLEYYLDPSGFSSLELKITQGLITATTLKNMDVILYAIRGTPPPRFGHFKISTKKAYISAAATEYIDLDRDHKYAALVVGEMDGVSADILSVLGNVKLNINAAEMIPYDEVGRDLFEQVAVETDLLHDNPPSTPVARTNFLSINHLNPWRGEDFLIDAPSFGKMVLEVTGLAAGTIRASAMELIK